MRESFCKAKVESSLPRVETIERRQLLSVTPAAVTPVTNPFIDLTATIAISSPKNDRILPGSRAGVSIEVFNTGNVPAKGPATGTLDLVAQGFDLVIANIAPHLRVPAGKHQILHESAVIPTGISPGAYAIEVNLATGGFQGSTTSTASATSGTLTVLDPFPNLLGVWSGIDHVVRGPSKGAKPTIELDFTSESDTDGALIATGTLFAGVSTSSFKFTGTITPKGIFTGIGSSSTSIFTATYKGKLAKNKLIGTVANTDGNFGNFKLVLESEG
jgi:hypothetical protein